ncbi:hypothetical protein GCM10011499_24640 [Pelagibacterium lentulum]|uniref:Uncharacterized protein n=1 Tax=Pelagibacterium lentulum TaxID=2029865 RepID=A0A916REW1_9HYPH|nr:hypothetical protein GCM10011499_24640 [Pelagibacterium lentulum]
MQRDVERQFVGLTSLPHRHTEGGKQIARQDQMRRGTDWQEFRHALHYGKHKQISPDHVMSGSAMKKVDHIARQQVRANTDASLMLAKVVFGPVFPSPAPA